MNTLNSAAITADGLKEIRLASIGHLIKKDWGSKVNFAAKPYLDAMCGMQSIDDVYGYDSGKSIVLYFLSNASTYRGENAKLIKAELKRRAGIK